MVPFSNTIKQAHTILFCVGGAYAAFLVALSLKPVQRSLVFLHQLRYPFWAEFDAPETMGFARKPPRRPLQLEALADHIMLQLARSATST
jgi:hypothetical protein